MTDWARIARLITLTTAIATAGCMSTTQIRPSSLAALDVAGANDATVTLRQPDGQALTVQRAVDAELVMTNGTRSSFVAPVSARVARDGSLFIRDANHQQIVRLYDVESASVRHLDTGSDDGATVAIAGALVIVAILGAAAIAAALADSMGSPSPPPTDTSGDWGGDSGW